MVVLSAPLKDLVGSHKDLILQEVIGFRLHLIAFDGKQHIDQSNVGNLPMIVQSEAVHVHVSENDVLLVQVPQHRHNLADYLRCVTFA